jgi:hypothetical protein
MYPLWVRSRRSVITYARSALPLKADVRELASLCPLRAITGREQSQQGSPLFDHLVGKGEELCRHIEPERFGCLEIDH